MYVLMLRTTLMFEHNLIFYYKATEKSNDYRKPNSLVLKLWYSHRTRYTYMT